MSRIAIVAGARGQIGRFLLPRLHEAGWRVHALTRGAPPPPADALHWHAIDLFGGEDLRVDADTCFSLGPLDGFAQWWQRSALRPQRIVAFGSTSVLSKARSSDPAERALAARLLAAEDRLLACAAERGAAVTLLRPTLIYGAGLDRNLSRIVEIARRWNGFVLPRNATGLRQPVHAQDLANAAFNAARLARTPQPCYALPGGETLAYREMVARVLACLDPPLPLYQVPATPLRFLLALARGFGAFGDAPTTLFERMRVDLVYDATSARQDLAYVPREFSPHRELFVS